MMVQWQEASTAGEGDLPVSFPPSLRTARPLLPPKGCAANGLGDGSVFKAGARGEEWD